MLLQCAVWEEHQLLSIIKRATHNWITSTTVQSYQFKKAHKHVQYYQCMAQSNQWEGRANYTTMRKSAVALVYQHIYANTNMIKASKSERNMRVELNQLEPSLVRVCSFERHVCASWCGPSPSFSEMTSTSRRSSLLWVFIFCHNFGGIV